VSDDGVLTSSWCTNWGAFNTPRLWAMVSDEDNPDAWRQVAAWGEVAVAVKDHRSRLVQAREALIAAWPPEQNGAARAFVTELDILIGHMDSASKDADDTATGLANILEALRTAKNQIQPLYEDYKQKSDDLVPSWWDNAEDEIDKKAQAFMVTAEQTVQQHVPQIKVPDAYTMDPKDARSDFTATRSQQTTSGGSGPSSSGGGRSGSRTDVAVPHDPVPPMPGQDATVPDGDLGSIPAGGGGSSGSGDGGAVIGGPGLAGVITPPPGSPPTGAPGTIPPIGGGLPGTGGPVPGATPPVTGAPIPGVLPGGPGAGGGYAGGGYAGGAGRGGGAGVGGVGAGGYARGTRPVAGATGRALPSGAVIGETVAGGARGTTGAGGVGGGMAGRGGTGGVSGRGGRGGAGGKGVAGGRIGAGGADEAGSRPGARTGAAKPKPPSWLPEDEPHGSARSGPGSGTPGLTGAGRRATRRDGESEQPFDPDNPWAVAEGVDPVIRPSDDNPRHDPGPNVIGWHG
jgi:hypothetical protein